MVDVVNNDIYIEKSISCTAAVNFLTTKGFKLGEKTFQHIINQLLNFEILELWALHLPQLTRNCSNTRENQEKAKLLVNGVDVGNEAQCKQILSTCVVAKLTLQDTFNYQI